MARIHNSISLNAEVDVNNENITYLTIRQQLENAKRDLNLVLGREANIPFSVDNAVYFKQGLSLEEVVQDANRRNATLLQADQLIRNSRYDVPINKAN